MSPESSKDVDRGKTCNSFFFASEYRTFLSPTMNTYLRAAMDAAKAAGSLIRENFMRPLEVNVAEAHDLKLELDVRAQELITDVLLREFPNTSVLGEEGSAETENADGDWIVDPIDGTVNFYYGIPHFS